MTEGVIIPAYDRVEFLHLCLEHIHASDEPPSQIVVVVDNHKEAPPSDDVLDYLKRETESGNLNHIVLTPHSYPGLSYAVMNALIYGMVLGWDRVFYIEDDIMVARDFFRWHREIHRHGDWFCSVGCRNHCETKIEENPDPCAYYTTDADYSALGVCFPAWAVEQIALHAHPHYWTDTTRYVQQVFPNSRVAPMYSQQAGVIRRMIEANPEWRSAWPCVPRGYHLGWFGHNCKGDPIPPGSFDERVAFVRSVMQDADKLNEMSSREGFMHPVDLSGFPDCLPVHHRHYL